MSLYVSSAFVRRILVNKVFKKPINNLGQPCILLKIILLEKSLNFINKSALKKSEIIFTSANI